MNKSVLFSDITIVTPHDGAPVSIVEHAYCSVAGNKIVYVGPSKEEASEALKDAGEVFEYNGNNKILCPTFANARYRMRCQYVRRCAADCQRRRRNRLPYSADFHGQKVC